MGPHNDSHYLRVSFARFCIVVSLSINYSKLTCNYHFIPWKSVGFSRDFSHTGGDWVKAARGHQYFKAPEQVGDAWTAKGCR